MYTSYNLNVYRNVNLVYKITCIVTIASPVVSMLMYYGCSMVMHKHQIQIEILVLL